MQGLHQGAQKSTKTFFFAVLIILSKFEELSSSTFAKLTYRIKVISLSFYVYASAKDRARISRLLDRVFHQFSFHGKLGLSLQLFVRVCSLEIFLQQALLQVNNLIRHLKYCTQILNTTCLRFRF